MLALGPWPTVAGGVARRLRVHRRAEAAGARRALRRRLGRQEASRLAGDPAIGGTPAREGTTLPSSAQATAASRRRRCWPMRAPRWWSPSSTTSSAGSPTTGAARSSTTGPSASSASMPACTISPAHGPAGRSRRCSTGSASPARSSGCRSTIPIASGRSTSTCRAIGAPTRSSSAHSSPSSAAGIEAFFRDAHAIFDGMYSTGASNGGIPGPIYSVEELLAFPKRYPLAARWMQPAVCGIPRRLRRRSRRPEAGSQPHRLHHRSSRDPDGGRHDADLRLLFPRRPLPRGRIRSVGRGACRRGAPAWRFGAPEVARQAYPRRER